jgi:hypothetical protein
MRGREAMRTFALDVHKKFSEVAVRRPLRSSRDGEGDRFALPLRARSHSPLT